MLNIDTIQKVKTTIIGASGVGASELAQNVVPTMVDDVSSGVNIVVQIVIAITTLFGLFKKRKKRN